MRMSKISLSDEAGGRGGVDAISAIYSRVRDDATARKKATYSWAELTSLAGQDFTVRCACGLVHTLDDLMNHLCGGLIGLLGSG